MTILNKQKDPISEQDLIADFKTIGIEKGMNIMIHSSLSQIGWVIGGAESVVRALIETVGKEGTIVMPSATPLCLHPSYWDNIEIPQNWMPKIEKHLPVFNVETTPTTMGIIPETFRNWPKAVRSNHPISSITASGKLAKEIIANHALEISEGKETPYEKVYAQKFKILLLGVSFNRCTMLHFAESLSKNRRTTLSHYQILQDGKREWVKVKDMSNDDNTHFPKIGKLYLASNKASISNVGNAKTILVSARDLVDLGTKYFNDLKS